MEDKCICCGADVSDMSTQVCNNCINGTLQLLNQSKVKMSKIERYYRECRKRLLYKNDKQNSFTQ